MLKIRPEQMKALSDALREAFEARALEYLRTSHPDSSAIQDEAALRDLICPGIERAEYYDITREIDVIRFLELLVTLGQDFDASQQFSDCLHRQAPAEERLDEIIEQIRFGETKPE